MNLEMWSNRSVTESHTVTTRMGWAGNIEEDFKSLHPEGMSELGLR